MSEPAIRPYRPEDRASVRRICFETGLMGASIAPQYADQESWADCLTSHYTDREPEHAQVVESEGEVVGYLLSTSDARRVRDPMLIALKHCLLRGICFRPGTAGFYGRAGLDMLRDAFAAHKPAFDLARYPGHTHSNLTPRARRGGLGTELFFRLYDQLKEEGVPGMHAEVMFQNERTLRWAEQVLGYRRHGAPYPVQGLRMPDGSRVQIQLILRDFDSWQVGAWKRDAAQAAAAR
jgi:hypothetical protein